MAAKRLKHVGLRFFRPTLTEFNSQPSAMLQSAKDGSGSSHINSGFADGPQKTMAFWPNRTASRHASRQLRPMTRTLASPGQRPLGSRQDRKGNRLNSSN